MPATPTGNESIDNATPRLLAAYLGVHRVLDLKTCDAIEHDTADELSRASAELALAYTALTGARIGEALGWEST